MHMYTISIVEAKCCFKQTYIQSTDTDFTFYFTLKRLSQKIEPTQVHSNYDTAIHVTLYYCKCNTRMFRVVFENSTFNKFHSESYSVLSPFLSKLRYAYHRNRKNMFYLLVQFKIESEIALKSL